jgi:hypothetical protein
MCSSQSISTARAGPRNSRGRAATACVLAVAAVALGVLAPVASAQPPGSATITTTFVLTSAPGTGGNPVTGEAAGTFSSSGAINDNGTVELQLTFGALPAPSTGVLQSLRTLTGQHGTITLRCTQIGRDFSDPADVPNQGSCAVVGGTGAYADLHGHGTLTGTADLTGTPTITDVLDLSTV